MAKRPSVLLAIVLLAGCESDVQKLGRLRREKEVAYGRMIAAQESGNVDSIRVTEQRLAVVEGQLNEFFKKK
jgi:hypothetical protein